MYEKIITYLKALTVLCITICFMLGADYQLLNTSKNIVIYCLWKSLKRITNNITSVFEIWTVRAC